MYGKKYQEILIDFGEVRDEVFPEWLRCSEKILIADLSEWKLESFLGLFTEKEKTGKDWICLTAFGSEIVRKEIERQFRLSVKRIPLSVDAFSVDIQTMEWFAGYIGIKEKLAVSWKIYVTGPPKQDAVWWGKVTV